MVDHHSRRTRIPRAVALPWLSMAKDALLTTAQVMAFFALLWITWFIVAVLG